MSPRARGEAAGSSLGRRTDVLKLLWLPLLLSVPILFVGPEVPVACQALWECGD